LTTIGNNHRLRSTVKEEKKWHLVPWDILAAEDPIWAAAVSEAEPVVALSEAAAADSEVQAADPRSQDPYKISCLHRQHSVLL
jgi:hypothetical protein